LHAGFVSPLTLGQVLLTDENVRTKVRRETNRALESSGHEKIADDKELISIVSSVFKFSAAPIDTLGGVHQEEDRAFLLGVSAREIDQSFCNTLARIAFTAERVGRLISAVELVPNLQFPQLSGVKLARSALLEVEVFKHLNYELIVRSPRLAVVEHRGKELVKRLFNCLVESEGELLPPDWKESFDTARDGGVSSMKRVICDYMACMTDRYAVELHSRLFGEGSTIFKPL